jgi:TM2 domain-containing membrane protein YozV
MSNPAPPAKNPPTVTPTYSPLPALLSYLVPGLGQIYQGRVAKGVLFMVCVYALFFYGMALGSWKNVYLPDTANQNNPLNLSPWFADLYNRPQFLGQFWVGIAAWPAIIQYNSKQPNALLGSFERTPTEEEINELERTHGKTRDIAWVYTVIAGVLNIMVIYDALAGPAFLVTPKGAGSPKDPGDKHAPAAAARR